MGAAGLGGNLTVAGGTATAVDNTVTINGASATLLGNIAGNVSVGGGAASADGAAAVATANGGAAILDGNVGGSITLGAASITSLNGGLASATGGSATINAAVTGDVTVGDGGSVAGEGTVGGTLTLGGTAGATLRIEAATAGALTVGTLSMDPGSVNTVQLDSLPLAAGPFVVLDYTTLASGDENNLVLPPGVFRGDPPVVNDGPKNRFTVTLDSQLRTWNGTANTDWNTSEENWDEGDQLFFSGDDVAFTDNGAGDVNLVGSLAPLSVTFSNTAGNDYSIIGTGAGIVGSTGIAKTDDGKVLLGGDNSFTGAVNVGSGVLALGSERALGNASVGTVAAGAQLDLNGMRVGNSANLTWTISGTGTDGVGGVGAITNSGDGVFEDSSIKHLVLATDSELGGNFGRFDVGRDGITGLGGSINGGNHTLTKVGTNAMVFRGPATNITYVVNEGMLTFEDFDAASGTNPITVNGGTTGSYNDRTLPNAVTFTAAGGTLISQGATGTWTGAFTLDGDVSFDTGGGNLVIDGSLAGTGTITKNGGNTLFLQNSGAGYSGKIVNTGGTLRVENAGALGLGTGADLLTLAGGSTLQGGTVTAPGSVTLGSATQGITQTGTGQVVYDAGSGNTLSLAGAVAGGQSSMVIANGTIAISSTLSLVDPVQGDFRVRAGGTAAFLSGANANIRNLALGDNGYNPAVANMSIVAGAKVSTDRLVMTDGGVYVTTANQTGGTLNITGTNNTNGTAASFLMGHWTGSSTYNLSGGMLHAPATALSLGWDSASGVSFNQSGGTANLAGVNLGNGRNNAAAYNLTGGRLNIGSIGITDNVNKTFSLGGGTLGAFANWASAKAITVSGTPTIDTLDSVDGVTARTISLSGALAGSGTLQKTGAGILALSGTGSTYSGTLTLAEGKLLLASSAVGAATVNVAAGSTVQPGTITAAGAASVLNLTMNGGTADFRVGAVTDMFNVTGAFAVNVASAITGIPGSVINGPFPLDFPVIDYTGTIGGLVGYAGLSYSSANPHLSGNLVHDPVNTLIKVQITAADSVIWKGNVNGNWNINTTANWVLGSDGTTPTKYYDSDVVSLNDIGKAQPVVTLVGAITPTSVAIEHSSGTYTLQGAGIGGGASLIKNGVGDLVLLNDNSYGGATSLTGGMITVGNGGTSGTLGGAGNVALINATLVFNRSDDRTFNRQVAGNGSVIKQGSGILTLTGPPFNLAGGSVQVDAGMLVLATADQALFNATGGIVVNTDAILRIDSTNLFNGGNSPITVNQGGVLELNANHNHFKVLNLNGGTVTGIAVGGYNNEYSTIDAAVNVGGSAMSTFTQTGTSNYSLGGGRFNVGEVVEGTDLLFSGQLSGGALSLYGSDTQGAGTMTITGNNTYTGGTNVEGGTLEAASISDIGGVGSIGTGYIGINNGSTFRYTGTTAETTVRLLWMDRGTLTNTIEIADAGAAITFTSLEGTRNKPFQKTGPGALAIDGPITAGAKVTVAAGKLTLTGINTYNGPTRVYDGATLSVNGDAIGDNGVLYMDNTAMVEVTTGTEIVSELFIDNVSQAVGTYGAAGSGADVEDAAHFSGSGLVSVTGPKFESWITKFGLTYENQAPAADPDGDGINNLLEYVLGGNPGVNDAASIAPTQSLSGGNLTLRFKRTDLSENDTVVFGQWSTSLGLDSWTDIVPVLVNENGTDADDMAVSVPQSEAVDGRLFIRLRVTKNLPPEVVN